MPRDLAILCDRFDCNALARDWRWLIPSGHWPLMIGAFGDWIFAAPDASHWTLCLLTGEYRQIARDADEFNRLKRDPENLDDWFKADLVMMAARHGMIPDVDQCLGWQLPPITGGPVAISNMQVFPLDVYQWIQGQIHRQIRLGH